VKHIRENKLRMTFTDALGQAQSQPDGVSNQKEARRLAFYLFWNVRTEYDRSGPLRLRLTWSLYIIALPVRSSASAQDTQQHRAGNACMHTDMLVEQTVRVSAECVALHVSKPSAFTAS